ncbi:unnamed protein product [Ranitomeya imitator]|uniref:Neuropeptide Y receptor type 2 n=1 Tax=Ranitomeya imitator TaxID=111125 RepID=A0ABN9MPJ5_9NEOB|nr:unnamed protein product [Ranitomeya imitator]
MASLSYHWDTAYTHTRARSIASLLPSLTYCSGDPASCDLLHRCHHPGCIFWFGASYGPKDTVILITAYSLIILLGLVGNSLVIYMILKYKNMKTVTNFFIANLAVADLMVDSLCLPFTLVYTLMDEWKFGSVLCHLLPYAQAMSVNVSTLTLVVIALDRYWCIVFHLSSRISKKFSFLIVTVTWVVASIFAIPLAIFREYRFEDLPALKLKIAVCAEKWPSNNSRDAAIYSISMLLLQYVLPLIVICFAYTRIWLKLKNHISPTPRSDTHQRRKKHN